MYVKYALTYVLKIFFFFCVIKKDIFKTKKKQKKRKNLCRMHRNRLLFLPYLNLINDALNRLIIVFFFS